MAVVLRTSEPGNGMTQSYAHLMGLAPEIRQIIFSYVLGIDNCRDESEHPAWVDDYRQTGNMAWLPFPGVASQSWLFNKSGPLSNTNNHSCIRGSSPWKVKLDLHPAILNVSKQLSSEGRDFIKSENIFIKIRTNIPRYDTHLRTFGLPVFTYHPRTPFEQWHWQYTQEFRTIIDIDMQIKQKKPLVTPGHFYLVPFKDIDQVIRALYLTNGRETASFEFMINIKHVPAHMKCNIEAHMTDWMSSFHPVGSISITIPARDFPNLDVAESLTRPLDIGSFVNAVKTLAGFKHSVEAPLLKQPAAEQKDKALNQLSRLSALFTENRPFLASSPPKATMFMATLASAPLYNLVQLEYTSATASTNNLSQWRRTVLPLSTLLMSLPHCFHNQRIQTLQIHLHTLTTLRLECRASLLLFDLLFLLRGHIWELNEFADHPAALGAGTGQDALDAAAAVERVRQALTKKTIRDVSGMKHALETGLVEEGSNGEALIMGFWQELCRDGWAMMEQSPMMEAGGEEGLARKMTLEDVWRVRWIGDFA